MYYVAFIPGGAGEGGGDRGVEASKQIESAVQCYVKLLDLLKEGPVCGTAVFNKTSQHF